MPSSSTADEESGFSSEDRISALPDGVLQHVLGFLPAHEAVQTSVLARRWCHLWKSMGRLRIIFSEKWKSAKAFCQFVNHLLLDREPSLALDEVQLEGYPLLNENDVLFHNWIQHTLLCQASVLSASTHYPCLADRFITLDNPSLVSQYLTRLELEDMSLKDNILDFASCPSLEDLKMTNCSLYTDKIASNSIKRLHIDACCTELDVRIKIAIPSLVWLHLHIFGSTAPLLESIPSLEKAFVKLEFLRFDYCSKGYLGERCGVCAICSGNDDHNGTCVLLGANF